MLLVYS